MPVNDGKTTIIRNGTLIDGSGRPPVENDAIVLRGDRRSQAESESNI